MEAIAILILLALILVVLIVGLNRGPRTAHGFFTRRCPFCREFMASRATVCLHCHQASKAYKF